MPKDEFDPEDPLELNGVAFFTEEDTTETMAECFIEEFMRLGYNPKQMLALFQNSYYTGMNMVLQNKGEPFVRDCIAATFAKWGRPFTWPDAVTDQVSIAQREQHGVPAVAGGAALEFEGLDPAKAGTPCNAQAK